MLNFFRFSATCNQISIGRYSFFFSFKTIVAFRLPGQPLICCRGSWGSVTTTDLNILKAKGNFKDLERELFKTELKRAWCMAVLDAAETVKLQLLNLEESHELGKTCDVGQTDHLSNGPE